MKTFSFLIPMLPLAFFLAAFPATWGGAPDWTSASPLPGPPFRVLADNDGMPGNAPPCIPRISNTGILVYIANTELLDELQQAAPERKAIPTNCPWPIYLYAYLGNDFENTLGVSAPLQFEPDPYYDELQYTFASVQLNFTPYLSSLCGNASSVVLNYTLTLVYEQEGVFYPYPECEEFFPAELFYDWSFTAKRTVTLACSGDCSEVPVEAESYPSTPASERTAGIRSGTETLPDRQWPAEDNSSLAQDAWQNRIFPNPFRDKLNLIIPPGQPGLVRLTLFNTWGKPLMEQILDREANELQWNMDTGKLPAGIYFLRIDHGGQSTTHRILKS